jgi:uncharacterized membrane protein YGL010W
MKSVQEWLDAYGESHKNATNKLIHWICVPAIMFTIFGLIMAIPFPAEKTIIYNWANLALVFVLVFYISLSYSMFIGFVIIGVAMNYGNYTLLHFYNGNEGSLALLSLIVFAVAWIFQFVGHKIEGAKPSFLEDIQFLLIGPAWLLHFIFKKLGIPYQK